MSTIDSTWFVVVRRVFSFSSIFRRSDLERLISRLLIDGYLKQEFLDPPSTSNITAYLRPGSNAVQLTNTQKIHIELTIRLDPPTKDEQRENKDERTIEQINEQCLVELKDELQRIFPSEEDQHRLFPDELLRDLVQSMPSVLSLVTLSLRLLSSVFSRRSKEKFRKIAHAISDELYDRFGLHRLLRLFHRFGSQRDEVKRQRHSSDSEEDLDFSIGVNERSKRPSTSIITITATNKRKRASGVSI